MSLAVQRDGEIAAVAAVDAPFPIQPQQLIPRCLQVNILVSPPKMRKHHYHVIKRGIHAQFPYLDTTCVYLQDRPGLKKIGIGQTNLQLFPLKLCKCFHLNIAL